jgi:hypothetical protein
MGILHTFLSPRRYMQGTGALAEVGTLVQPLGEHAFVLYDRGVAELWARRLRPALAAACLGVSGAEFAAVWAEVEAELTAHPERTAKAAFEHLQERYPGIFTATQVRTLQRRVQEWRMRTLLAFDDEWLGEELLVRRSFPLPLREIVASRTESEQCLSNAPCEAETCVCLGFPRRQTFIGQLWCTEIGPEPFSREAIRQQGIGDV